MLKVPSTILITTGSLILTQVWHSSPVYGICVATDVSVQMSIRGSQVPSQQSNHVGIQNNDNCWNNVTTNTSVQLYNGSGTVQQTRNSFHSFEGSKSAPLGLQYPIIQNQIYVPVDVYSPAYDPNFLGNFKPNY
jgi:hypothetical protein